MNTEIDILMITHNRPEYTRMALTRLLETCDSDCRVWLWHNGQHEETLEVVRSFLEHPCIHKFHHSEHNVKLTEPTNWLWKNSTGSFVSKVDDDCLVPPGWIEKLRKAHHDEPRFGALGCWRFMDEDFDEALASWKIREYGGGHQVLQNCWIEGSGYLMKRKCIDQAGVLGPKQSFTNYLIRLSTQEWINGWYFPFLYQEHMDDPRAEHTLLHTYEDFKRYTPLTAKTFQSRTLEEWTAAIQRDAVLVQCASLDPSDHMGWRPRIRHWMKRWGGRLVSSRE